MTDEYTLIDCKTELVYGPYETLARARCCAEEHELEAWEIIDAEGKVIEWTSIKLKT